MTAASAPAPTAPPPLPVAVVAAAPSRWSRWSDRLNPILVREVQQALKSRVFVAMVFVALAFAVTIAIAAAREQVLSGVTGRNTFHRGIAVLVPLVFFVVPMQAYQSMRLELRGGIVEQLLLSRLRPLRILFGKLQAAMVQFVVYVAVLAPLLATSYLLRGVDVPTIVVSLGFAALGCVTATSFAVSCAAQGVVPGLQPLANLATAFGLGMATTAFTGFAISGEYGELVGTLLRHREAAAVLVAILLGGLGASTLALLAARAFLLHAFENRATPFRIALFVLPAVAFAWVLWFLPATMQEYAVPVVTVAAIVGGAGFAWFMITEQRELSPRLRAHAPRSPLAAVLAAPFLPGRDRGVLCFALFTAVMVAVVWTWPAFVVSANAGFAAERLHRFAAAFLAYALVYAWIGHFLRGRLPATVQGNHLGRFLLPIVLFLFLLVPSLCDVFVRGEVDDWHVGHAMNPFWTIEEYVWRRDSWPAADAAVRFAIPVALVLLLPAMVRGVREVMAASAMRRARADVADA